MGDLMKKKVGIVSCYFKHNYGSMLQAYATQKILDDFNIDNETINIELIDKEIGSKKRKYYMSQILNFSFIKTKLGMVLLKIYCKFLKRDLGRNIDIRNKKFNEFQKEFKMSKKYKSMEELNKECTNYSDVLVGSDQLWLPVNIVADYYTLNFVPEKINKISYATSFGVSHISNNYVTKYREFLSRINYISTREESGIKLIKEITGEEVNIVCDPTLLFDKEEWMHIQQVDRLIEEKYILCYFLGKNIEHRKFAERLKEKTGYKIVSLNHLDEYVKYSEQFADYKPYDIGPAEFINLIRNAEYVCTDSFHGTVFSLINNKRFFTFKRYNPKLKVSTNSRIESLLNIVGLQDRLLIGDEDISKYLNKEIDYEEANKKIENFREESKKFLKDALEVGTKL